MHQYEVMCALSTQEDGVKKGRKILEDLFSAHQIKITAEEDFKVKELAYPVRGERQAQYQLYKIETENTDFTKIQDILNHERTLLRYLFIKTEE